jgi:hypothetical protein
VKALLTVTAGLEAGAGLALLLAPSLAARVLLGVPLEAPAALTVARVCGGGLLALGVACWVAGDDSQSRAARGIVVGMLIYNVATALALAYAGVGFGLHGILLWPVVFLHGCMAAWCVTSLRRKTMKGRLDNSLLT